MVELLAIGYAALALAAFIVILYIVWKGYNNSCSWCYHPHLAHTKLIGNTWTCDKCKNDGETCYISKGKR